MSKPKISKKVHNAFVKEYKDYERRYNFSIRALHYFIENGDVTKVKESEEYCMIYLSKMIALDILYQKLTGQRLEGK